MDPDPYSLNPDPQHYGTLVKSVGHTIYYIYGWAHYSHSNRNVTCDVIPIEGPSWKYWLFPEII